MWNRNMQNYSMKNINTPLKKNFDPKPEKLTNEFINNSTKTIYYSMLSYAYKFMYVF